MKKLLTEKRILETSDKPEYLVLAEKIDKSIARLSTLEDVLTKSLNMFQKIFLTSDFHNLEELMDKESALIIDQFQKVAFPYSRL